MSWYNERHRHQLAAKGITTRRYLKTKFEKRRFSEDDEKIGDVVVEDPDLEKTRLLIMRGEDDIDVDTPVRWKKDDPEYIEHMSEIQKMRWENPDYRKRMSEIQKRKWEDPEYRAKMSAIAGEHFKKMWSNPDFYQRMVEERSTRDDPEYREMMSRLAKERYDKYESVRAGLELGRKMRVEDVDLRNRLRAHNEEHAKMMEEKEARKLALLKKMDEGSN